MEVTFETIWITFLIPRLIFYVFSQFFGFNLAIDLLIEFSSKVMPKYSPFGIPFWPTVRYRGDFHAGGKEGLKPLRVWQGSWGRLLKSSIPGLGNLGLGKT